MTKTHRLIEQADRDREIANTIANQLGGIRRLGLMTGAKNFVAIEDGLMFSVGGNCKRVNRIEIKLNGRDLYDVRLMNISVRRPVDEMVQVLDELGDVYFGQLPGVIENGTGMVLSLGTMGAGR